MYEGKRLRRGGCRQVKAEKIPYFCFSERIWSVQNTPEPSYILSVFRIKHMNTCH